MDIKTKASLSLKKSALNHEAKAYLLNNPVLFNLALKAAKRYIGGETLEEALTTREALQKAGYMTSLEFMGENVTTKEEAIDATHEFLRIIKALKNSPKKERVSLDLSHLGLQLDHKLGMDNFKLLAEESKNTSVELVISAEGTDATENILQAYLELSKKYPHVHITLQVYLHRSAKDLERLLKESKGKIRLVKGAYDGPKELFLERGDELDDRYVAFVEKLLSEGRPCSIATHDPKMIARILPLIKKYKPSHYEFEMLYGIGDELFSKLKSEGHPCRRYIVYGKEWYLYLLNRISEYPDNLFQAVVDLLN